jgi:hypothetical protein
MKEYVADFVAGQLEILQLWFKSHTGHLDVNIPNTNVSNFRFDIML